MICFSDTNGIFYIYFCIVVNDVIERDKKKKTKMITEKVKLGQNWEVFTTKCFINKCSCLCCEVQY